MNLLVRGMGRAVADWMAEVVVFLNGAPVMVGMRGKLVPVPRRARMFMGRRRRARAERMKCCIFWFWFAFFLVWKVGEERNGWGEMARRRYRV